MNLSKDRKTLVNDYEVTLKGDGSHVPLLTFETSEMWVDGDDLIALGKQLQKWGKKLNKSRGD